MLFKKKLGFFKKPNKEAERKLREDIANEGGLEKSDVPAMIIAAFLVIGLPVGALLIAFGALLFILFT